MRQSKRSTRSAVSGAKTVLANPATRVSTVRATTRPDPYQRVSAANAGGYSAALIATPANSHPATNTPKFGAVATAPTASTPRTEPVVMSQRGPCRSRKRPTKMPSSADTTRAAENAPVRAAADQPVSALIWPDSTGNA